MKHGEEEEEEKLQKFFSWVGYDICSHPNEEEAVARLVQAETHSPVSEDEPDTLPYWGVAVGGYNGAYHINFSWVKHLKDETLDALLSAAHEEMVNRDYSTGTTADSKAEHPCKFCLGNVPDEPNFHQGQPVCGNCWDERLRLTE